MPNALSMWSSSQCVLLLDCVSGDTEGDVVKSVVSWALGEAASDSGHTLTLLCPSRADVPLTRLAELTMLRDRLPPTTGR